MSKKGLGRGLQALLPNAPEESYDQKKIIEIEVKDIRVNRQQPRRTFNQDKLQELAFSIKEHGVVQPILVKAVGQGKYELVAGERRWRACQLIGQEKVPAIVKELTEKETSEIALIENIQREDLNPIEEAGAYKTLMDEYGLTQEELSARVGKSRPFIANSVRLLALPEEVKGMVAEGSISAGHARALLAITKQRELEAVARRIAQRGLSVRQTEKAVKDLLVERTGIKKKIKKQDPILKELEERLKKKLSTKVRINHGKKTGTIEIEYYGEEDLQRLLDALLGEIEL